MSFRSFSVLAFQPFSFFLCPAAAQFPSSPFQRRAAVALLEEAAEVRRLFVVQPRRHLLCAHIRFEQQRFGQAQAQFFQPVLRRGAELPMEAPPQRPHAQARQPREPHRLKARPPRQRGPFPNGLRWPEGAHILARGIRAEI